MQKYNTGFSGAAAEVTVDRVIGMIRQALNSPRPKGLMVLSQVLGFAQEHVDEWVKQRLKAMEEKGLVVDDTVIKEALLEKYNEHYQELYDYLTFARKLVLADVNPHPKFDRPKAKFPTEKAATIYEAVQKERDFVKLNGVMRENGAAAPIAQRVGSVIRRSGSAAGPAQNNKAEDIGGVICGANIAAWLKYKEYFPQNDKGQFSFSWLKFLGQDKVDALGALVSHSCFDSCDLSGLDLSKWNLEGADLSNAKLAGATLPPKMKGADVSWADLRGVVLPPKAGRRLSKPSRSASASEADSLSESDVIVEEFTELSASAKKGKGEAQSLNSWLCRHGVKHENATFGAFTRKEVEKSEGSARGGHSRSGKESTQVTKSLDPRTTRAYHQCAII